MHVDSSRSDLGAIQNRFETAINNLQTKETILVHVSKMLSLLG
tara:strand:+ start:3203 stop:3331 length:129 start_codon:yes stop_codon:yes gene_type:complete